MNVTNENFSVKKNLPFYIILVGFSSILLTVFISCPEIVDGTIVGKLSVIHPLIVILCFSFLFLVISKRKQLAFKFKIQDILFVIFSITIVYTYNWKLNPAPDQLYFYGQLFILWFILRISLTIFPNLELPFLIILVFTSLIEAIIGILQIVGYLKSNHPLFAMTGTFFNPGPYSGYLAMILPLVIGFILNLNEIKLQPIIKSFFFYFLILTLVLILYVFPLSMSRAGWLAAFSSVLWVFWHKFKIGKLLIKTWKKHPLFSSLTFITTSALILIFIIQVYAIKKDSADGRVFIWKITLKSIVEEPISGNGLGGFAESYSKAQIDYFLNNESTSQERLIAGNPEYAFNEFLQIWSEQGLFGIIIFISLIVSCFYIAVKNKKRSICGVLISLMVFSCFSYPLQLPSFLIVLIFILPICISYTPKNNTTSSPDNILLIGFIFLFAILSTLLYVKQNESYQTHLNWARLKKIFNQELYTSVLPEYQALYPKLAHKHQFLFEYGLCLNKVMDFNASNKILEKAAKLSTDPMILNIRSKNHQGLMEYNDAEKLLKKSINLQPSRIYPYYLLAQLYSEDKFNHPQKMKRMADSVLLKRPKIYNDAIKEMRKDIIILLKKQKSKN